MTALIKPHQESLLDPLGTSPSLLLIQYDLSSSFSPVLGQIVKDLLARQAKTAIHHLGHLDSPLLHTLDYSSIVPDYSDESVVDLTSAVRAKLSSIPKGPIALLIDSADVMLSDSDRAALKFLQADLADFIPIPAAPVSHINELPSQFLHSPLLLSHLVHQYHLTLPPVNTVPDPLTSRFWSVFIPVARRGTGEKLALATGIDGLSGALEIANPLANRNVDLGVVEINTRSRVGGQKGVRIVLRPWQFDHERNRIVWCEWNDIQGLRAYESGHQDLASTAPGIDNLSFNLQLSDAQQQARASVPLPYTNEGKAVTGDSEIIYIPDQADDFDDDDPDDDLYI